MEVKKSKKNNNVEYIGNSILQNNITTYSKASLMRINTNKEEVSIILKIGRYKKMINENFVNYDVLECSNPKSELTLNNNELLNLIEYIDKNYFPLKNNEKNYISLSDSNIKEIINNNPNNLLKIITTAINEKIDMNDIEKILELTKRNKSLKQFEYYYKEDAIENKWETWFNNNPWVFDSVFVNIIDDRRIDVLNISDFLVKSFDGYTDIIEIKRVGSKFFEIKKDHENLIPSQELIKAITQLSNYIKNLEMKANDIDTNKRIGNLLKPKGLLIYGSSRNWTNDEFQAYRLLNDTLNNITIITYDMVYLKAKKMIELSSNV